MKRADKGFDNVEISTYRKQKISKKNCISETIGFTEPVLGSSFSKFTILWTHIIIGKN